MKNVQIDPDGNLRCWKCGASAFTEKRTTRSKVLFGVGALATKKKLRCQACGEYNDVGSADPVGGAKAAEAEATAAAETTSGWVKMTAGDLRAGDRIKQMGMTSVVESVEAGKLGLTIVTDKGKLRAIARSTPMTVQRRRSEGHG